MSQSFDLGPDTQPLFGIIDSQSEMSDFMSDDTGTFLQSQ